MLPAPLKKRRAEWDTMRSDYPGCFREGQKVAARVSWRGRWAYLGLFTEWTAGKVGRVARELKRAGALDRCATAADVRRAVLTACNLPVSDPPLPIAG